MEPLRPFERVSDPEPELRVNPPPPQSPPFLQSVSIQMLGMALAALGQRALLALSACFTLLTVGSGFYLWLQTPNPTDRQIVSLTIYAVFILLINWLAKRK